MKKDIGSAINTVNPLDKQSPPKQKAIKKQHDASNTPNYVAIAESSEFKALKKRKNKFILPISIFFLLFYISLPVLTSYTTVLNQPAIGDISWVWVFAMAQFIMTWTLCMIYVSKSNSFDKQASEIIEKEKAGGYV